ncbi:MAG: 30S ribosomal protein S6 [Phycisphaerales bacterium JB039]
MAADRRYNYEAMFLISQAVAADLAGAVEHINEILRRADAQLIAMSKWDERRLAFEIDKQKRGVFILTYFSAPATKVDGITRDCNLSERIMRLMLLRADHLTEDEMKATDARDALMTEAKMRAERAAQEEAEGRAAVTVGAPTRDEEEPADEADAGDEGDDES